MTAGHQQAAGRLNRALAGLQAGTIGALNMLLWLGVCSMWRRQGFWAGPGLLARTLRPQAVWHAGGIWSTTFGVALYVLLYGMLGTVFALAAGRPMRQLRLTLVAMAFALAWYWIVYRWLWRAVPPAAALLYGGRAAVLGHLLYGAFLGRFPRYLPQVAVPELAPVADEQAEMNSEVRPD